VGGLMTASREEARAAVEAAERAFTERSATPAAGRSRLLERASELLMDRAGCDRGTRHRGDGGLAGLGHVQRRTRAANAAVTAGLAVIRSGACP
jgi:hypothetical protein